MRRLIRWASVAARVAAGALVVRRIARVATAAAPVSPPTEPPKDRSGITVVVPARDEAGRIGPLLAVIVGAPGVATVLVVDDESSDDTAAIARAAGADVLVGAPKPEGWAGKAWALQQGIDAATTDWIVTLDADTRPDPCLPAAVVTRMVEDRLDLLTLAGRFECPTAPTRWLQASMLTTLVYRFGSPGVAMPADRTMANGQCMAFRRDRFIEAGGMAPVADEVVEDIALARALATAGWSVGFLDASELLTVRMFESFRDALTGWGRSLALPGVERPAVQLRDLAVVVLAQALPLPRVVFGRGDVVDVCLALMRLGTLVGTRTALDRADVAYWLSPAADLVSAGALARGIARGGRQTWRGRAYG